MSEDYESRTLHLVRLHACRQLSNYGDITNRFFIAEGQLFHGSFENYDDALSASKENSVETYYPKIVFHPPTEDDECCMVLCFLPGHMPMSFYWPPWEIRPRNRENAIEEFMTLCKVNLVLMKINNRPRVSKDVMKYIFTFMY